MDRDLQVSLLPFFEGPLALLLHLVRVHRLQVGTLRLAELTGPYLDELERLQRAARALDLDLASEFLQIAATLIGIKARALLPSAAEAIFDPQIKEDDAATDLESMLLLRLHDYELLQRRRKGLFQHPMLGREVFAPGGSLWMKPTSTAAQKEAEPAVSAAGEALFADAVGEPADDGSAMRAAWLGEEAPDAWSLLETFMAMMAQAERRAAQLELVPEAQPIEAFLRALVHRLASLEGEACEFFALCGRQATRRGWLTYFVALLELVRLGGVSLRQEEPFGHIHCVPRPALRADPHAWLKRIETAMLPAPS